MTSTKAPRLKFTFLGGGVLSKPRSDGKVVYYIRYRWQGRSVVERVGLTEQAARAKIASRRDQAKEIPNWVPPTLKRRDERRAAQEARRAAEATAKPQSTFADVIAVYRRECVPTKRDAEWQLSTIATVEKEFGTVALSDMTPERIESWRDRLAAEKKSPSTIRKYVYFVSGIYSDTLRTSAGRKLVQENPCRLVALPLEPKGLRRSLTAEQAAAFLRAARDDSTIYRWSSLVLSTGMRVEEAQRIQWEHASLEWSGTTLMAAQFAVHETKTGQPRYVEAGDQLLPDLEAWWKADGPNPNGLVIGETFKAFPHSRWRSVFKAAGVQWGSGQGQFTTRNLRTTFCQLAFENGARPEELVQQTGHSIQTLFAHYAQASREQRLRAVNLLPDLRRGAMRSV